MGFGRIFAELVDLHICQAAKLLSRAFGQPRKATRAAFKMNIA